jgi:hypothetical protein
MGRSFEFKGGPFDGQVIERSASYSGLYWFDGEKLYRKKKVGDGALYFVERKGEFEFMPNLVECECGAWMINTGACGVCGQATA